MKNKWLRWLLYAVAGLVAVIGCVYAIGMTRSPEVVANATIEIAKPVPYVYNLIADPKKQKDWFGGIDSIEVLSEVPLRYRMNAGGASSEMELTIAEPGRRLVTRSLSHSMGMSGEWDTRFEAIPNGTRVIHSAKMNFPSPFLRFMAMIMDANKEELASLESLKKYAESH